jgi:diacylglycerol O-acyltransferase / wax synthase
LATDRLTPLDTSFLHLEDPATHMHVACVMVFEGDPPAYHDFVGFVDSRLHMVPRYRQKLASVPLGQGRPRWVDDDCFDVRYHVRSTALPGPGGEHELQVLAGRVFGQQLNRDKPLWEMWLVEGLEGGRFAVLSKTHHALVDGVSGLDILSVLFAPEEQARDASAWVPRPAPSPLGLLVEALVERLTMPAELVRPVRALLRRPQRFLGGLLEAAVGVGAFAWAGLSPAPRTPYNARRVSGDRRFTWVRASLGDLKAIKNAAGGTVNDVVLTIVTRALRRDLERRGEDVEGVDIKAFVPVSVRSEDESGTLGNKVAGMIAALPISCPDPLSCLARISEQMRTLKDSGQAVGAQALTELMGFAPPVLMDQASRLAARQRFFNLVVTNVPGPQFPLYLMERELKDIFPMVPLSHNAGLGVAIVSYNGGMNFGLVGDFHALADLELLTEHFDEALRELAEAAGVRLGDTAEAGAPPAAVDEGPLPVLDEFEAHAHGPDREATLVAESAELEAADGPGPELRVEEPWEGYRRMTAPEIAERLAGAPEAVAAVVRLYEGQHRRRQQVLRATERALAGG